MTEVQGTELINLLTDVKAHAYNIEFFCTGILLVLAFTLGCKIFRYIILFKNQRSVMCLAFVLAWPTASNAQEYQQVSDFIAGDGMNYSNETYDANNGNPVYQWSFNVLMSNDGGITTESIPVIYTLKITTVFPDDYLFIDFGDFLNTGPIALIVRKYIVETLLCQGFFAGHSEYAVECGVASHSLWTSRYVGVYSPRWHSIRDFPGDPNIVCDPCGTGGGGDDDTGDDDTGDDDDDDTGDDDDDDTGDDDDDDDDDDPCEDENDTDCDGCPDAYDPSPDDNAEGCAECEYNPDIDCDEDRDGCPDELDPEPNNDEVGCEVDEDDIDSDGDGCPDKLDPEPENEEVDCEDCTEDITDKLNELVDIFNEWGVDLSPLTTGNEMVVSKNFTFYIPGVGSEGINIDTKFSTAYGPVAAEFEIIRVTIKSFFVVMASWVFFMRIIRTLWV